MEWQPIATAPKDGTHFLAYRLPKGERDFRGFPPMVVHYWSHQGEEGFYLSHGDSGLHPLTLEYWMPFEPPAKATASEGAI